MRIASLLASATEIVCALGLEERLVAISHECDHPPRVLDRPRISRPRFDPAGLSAGEIDAAVRRALAEHHSVYQLDAAALRAARPDVLLTQAVCDVCAVPTSLAAEAAAVLDPPPAVVSLDAHSVDGIFDTIGQVGAVAGVPGQAARLVDALRRRLDAVAAAVAGRPRPRVLVLEWLDPPFVPGHWGPEMITLAGGENLAGTAAARSHTVAWDELERADPDVLVLAPCGYDLPAARREADTHADRLCRVAPRAVAAGRALVMDASAYFNRSGPRVVDGVEALAAALHPDRASSPPPPDCLAPWTPAG